ncbi:mechanosensitive ion channel family protein [soil metagenome]
MDDIIVYIDEIRPLILIFAGRALLALFLLVIGFLLIRLARQGLKRILVLRGVDESLHHFLGNIFSISLKVILIISVISILGIETTSFIAVIGSAGLAIGLALQGSLSNFAGGVLILTIKPFRKGDFITSMGDSGTVHTINIFNTILKTPDNQTVHIPNGKLAGSTIINFSEEPTRRLVINIGISYSEDVTKAKNILRVMIEEEEKILKEPVPQVIMNAFNESSINLALRVWCKKEDYWEVNFALHEKLKQRFDENNITIPFPQRDVHVKT